MFFIQPLFFTADLIIPLFFLILQIELSTYFLISGHAELVFMNVSLTASDLIRKMRGRIFPGQIKKCIPLCDQTCSSQGSGYGYHSQLPCNPLQQLLMKFFSIIKNLQLNCLFLRKQSEYYFNKKKPSFCRAGKFSGFLPRIYFLQNQLQITSRRKNQRHSLSNFNNVKTPGKNTMNQQLCLG